MDDKMQDAESRGAGVQASVYRYDQEIQLSQLTLWETVTNGGTFMFTIHTPMGMVKVRAYRLAEDPEGEVRMYNNSRDSYVFAPSEGVWTQVPGMQTDFVTTGDMENGIMTFRAHVDDPEPQPVI